MTKPFTPEFTTRAQAIVYVKAGRKGLTRPTKDAWNTHVELRDSGAGTHTYDAVLVHDGNVLLRYFLDPSKRERVEVITTSGSTHTMRKRINDYALTSRGLELLTDLSIRGQVGTAVGNRDLIVPVIGRMGSVPGVCFIEDDNSVSGLTPGVRWPRDEARAIAKDWANAMVTSLENDRWSEDLDTPLCFDCSSTTSRIAVGRMTGDREHLFAHIFGPQYNPSLLSTYCSLPHSMLNEDISGRLLTVGQVSDKEYLTYIRKRLVSVALEVLK